MFMGLMLKKIAEEIEGTKGVLGGFLFLIRKNWEYLNESAKDPGVRKRMNTGDTTGHHTKQVR